MWYISIYYLFRGAAALRERRVPIAKTPPSMKEEYHRMSIIIPPELHRQFKTATAAEGKEMTAVLLDFVRQYVKEHLPAGLKQKKTGGRK